jgi:hypothetical protein
VATSDRDRAVFAAMEAAILVLGVIALAQSVAVGDGLVPSGSGL